MGRVILDMMLNMPHQLNNDLTIAWKETDPIGGQRPQTILLAAIGNLDALNERNCHRVTALF